MVARKKANSPVNTGAIQAERPRQTVVQIVDSGDTEAIRKNMEATVDGWADMSAKVQDEIIALNVEIHAMHRSPVMALDGENTIGMNKNNPQLHTMRLMKTLASGSPEFVNYVVTQLAQTLNKAGALSVENINAGLSFIAGIGPKNEAEAILAMQMFVTNDAALRAVKVMHSTDYSDTRLAFGNMTAKLMRTFTMQAEAMAKLQRGGVQRVEHYYIDNRGGQAVIADTVNTGGQNGKIAQQCEAAGNFGTGSPMRSENAAGNVLPIASRAGQETMPDARRDQSRSA